MTANSLLKIALTLPAVLAVCGTASAQITPGGFSTGGYSGGLGGGLGGGGYYSSPSYYARPYSSPYMTRSYTTSSYSSPLGGGVGVAGGGAYRYAGGNPPVVVPFNTERSGYFSTPVIIDMPAVGDSSQAPAFGMNFYTKPNSRRWWWR